MPFKKKSAFHEVNVNIDVSLHSHLREFRSLLKLHIYLFIFKGGYSIEQTLYLSLRVQFTNGEVCAWLQGDCDVTQTTFFQVRPQDLCDIILFLFIFLFRDVL